MSNLFRVPRNLAGRAWRRSISRLAAPRTARNRPSERLWDEHSSLRNELASAAEAMRRLADSGGVGPPDRRALRRLLRKLATLERRLRDHFAAEEAGGHLADALQAAPRYHARAGALLSQHPGLSAEMHRLRTQARHSANSPDAWEAFHRSFVQLAELISAHEEAEGEIVRCSLQDDLGTVD